MLLNANKVNFITIPAQKIKYETEYFPARPGSNYYPINGQFIFEPGAKIAKFNFSIYFSDNFYASHSDQMFSVFLLNVENCDYCQLGTARQADVYLKFVKPSLIAWNTGPSSNLSLNNPNRICGTNKEKYPIKLNAEFYVVDGNKLSSQVLSNVVKSTFLSTDNSEIFINPGRTECINITVLVSNRFTYCYNVSFQLKVNVSYVLNRSLSLFSLPVSADAFDLNLASTNCCSISFASSFLNGSNSLRILLNSSNSTERFRIPLELNPLCSNLGLIDLIYAAEYDSYSNEFLIFSDTEYSAQSNELINEKYMIRKDFSLLINTRQTNTIWFIDFNLTQMENFNYYLFNIKLSLLNSEDGRFKIDNKGGFVSIDFVTKSQQNNETLCSLVSLSQKLTKFSYNNLKTRLLNISFESLPIEYNITCIIDVRFSITKLDSPNANIQDYILEDPENFFHMFLSSSKIGSKRIYFNNRIYMSKRDLFLVNLTSIQSSDKNMTCYLNSPRDAYLILAPSDGVANGPAILTPSLDFIEDKWNPYDLDNYNKLTLNLMLTRLGSYWTAQALYSLELTPESGLSIDRSEDRTSILQLTDVYLRSSEMNRTFKVILIKNVLE